MILSIIILSIFLSFSLLHCSGTSNVLVGGSKAFRVFNKRTMVVEESIHVIFYE